MDGGRMNRKIYEWIDRRIDKWWMDRYRVTERLESKR